MIYLLLTLLKKGIEFVIVFAILRLGGAVKTCVIFLLKVILFVIKKKL